MPQIARLGRRSGLLCGRRGGFLLMEAQCTELVGDELHTFEAEGLGRRERWGCHHPSRGIAGSSREPKRIVSSRLAAEAVNGVIETIHLPKQ